MKSLLQRAIKKISLELREVSISMSKSQQWVCFNDTHCQCNDSSTLIALSISESIRLSVHMQLVSLLQWHLSSMQWSIYSHRSIYQWIDLSHVSVSTSESATRADNDWSCRQSQSLDSESATKTDNDWSLDWVDQRTKQALLCSRFESEVSLLQWHNQNQSLRWASRLVSLLQRHCQCNDLSIYIALSLSESASMTRFKSISSMS